MMIKNKLIPILFLFWGVLQIYGDNENQKIVELGNELNYKNVKFIKKDTFEKVKELFIDKSLSGNFKYMDLQKSNYYRKEYFKMLRREKSYIDEKSEEKFDEDIVKNKRALVYYFFDMNGDNIPELVCNNTPYSVEVFTFDKIIQKVKKLTSFISGTEFLGDNKIYLMYGGIGEYNHYIRLDDKGKYISETIFYSGTYPNENNEEEDKILYTIGCGDDTKQFNQLKNISEKNNEIIYYNQRSGVYCFRITEEQSNELMKPYIKVRETAKENIKKVTFTYNELFGEFEKTKKVISDILNWKHPTKDVFKKYGIELKQVEITENYPTFYTNFKKKISDDEMKKILEELLKANGYWDFEIKDEFNKRSIKIFGDRKNKELVKYEYK